jgi:hypothetical protein
MNDTETNPKEIQSHAVTQPSVTERTRALERNSRAEVLRSFNTTFSLLERAPEDQLTPHEQWIRSSIESAKQKTIDQGKDTFTNSFANLETGEVFRQEEGIPIEGLLDFIKKQVDALEPGSPQKQELINAAHTLYRSSRRYTEYPERMEPSQLLGRVRQEAYFISQDHRATGDQVSDYFKGNDTLMGRLELVLPSEKPEVIEPSLPEPTQPEVAAPITGGGNGEPNPDKGGTTPPVPPEEQPTSTEEPPVPEPPQEPEPEKPLIREFGIGNQTADLWNRARMEANRLIEAEMGRTQNRLKRWGIEITKEHWRQRLTEQIVEAARVSGSPYAKIGLESSQIRFRDLFRRHGLKKVDIQTGKLTTEELDATQAKINEARLRLEHGTNSAGIRVKAEEKNQVVEAPEKFKEAVIQKILRPLINDNKYSSLIDRPITNTADLQEALRILVAAHQNNPDITRLFGSDDKDVGRIASYFATDLMQMSEQVKADIKDHRYAVDQLDQHTRILLFNTRWASDNPTQFNRIDKIVTLLERHRLTGHVLNAATIGAAVSLATFAATKSLGVARVAGLAVPVGGLIGVAAGSAVGGAVAGARAIQHEKEALAMHRQERAYNLQPEGKAPHRADLDKLRFNTVSAENLSQGLKDALAKGLEEGAGIDAEEVRQNREAVLNQLAEITGRMEFSLQNRKHFITFSGEHQGDKNNTQLLAEVIAARQVLEKAGMAPDDIFKREETLRDTFIQNTLKTDYQEVNQKTSKYLKRKGAEAAGKGFLIGGATGSAMAAVVNNIDLIEQIPGVGTLFQRGKTAAEDLANRVSQAVNGREVMSYLHNTTQAFKELYQNGGSKNLGDHLLATVDQANHTIDITNTTTGEIAHGEIDLNGTIHNMSLDGGESRQQTDAFLKQLKDKQFQIKDYKDPPQPKVVEMVKQITGQHGSETTFNYHSTISVDMNADTHEVTMVDLDEGTKLIGRSDAEGNLYFDAAKNPDVDLTAMKENLEKPELGFTVSEMHTRGAAGPQDVTEYFKDKELLEHANRMLWHDNDTPMHLNENGAMVGPDGKELQFHHNALADGTVDLDMSKMISENSSGINWDETVDSQYSRVMNDIITNPDGSRTYKNFEFLITPNDAADQSREVIKLVIDENGHAQLPPGADLHQFFDVKDGHVTQLARFVEVAHVNPDGTRDILSTSIGKGVDQITVTTPGTDMIKVTPPSDITKDLPPGKYTFGLIPPENPVEPPPPIPIIPEWGRPLEPMKPPKKEEEKKTPDEQQTGPDQPKPETPKPKTPEDQTTPTQPNNSAPAPAQPNGPQPGTMPPAGGQATAQEMEAAAKIPSDAFHIADTPDPETGEIIVIANPGKLRQEILDEKIPAAAAYALRISAANQNKEIFAGDKNNKDNLLEAYQSITDVPYNPLENTVIPKIPMEQLNSEVSNLPETEPLTIDQIQDNIESMHNNRELVMSDEFLVPDNVGGKFIWQDIRFGKKRTKGSNDCFRGYIMAEPEDFPKVLNILLKLGEERQSKGDRLEFKWLKGKISWNATAINPNVNQNDYYYKYDDLKARDPRFALYADDPQEIHDILWQLAQNP